MYAEKNSEGMEEEDEEDEEEEKEGDKDNDTQVLDMLPTPRDLVGEATVAHYASCLRECRQVGMPVHVGAALQCWGQAKADSTYTTCSLAPAPAPAPALLAVTITEQCIADVMSQPVHACQPKPPQGKQQSSQEAGVLCLA
ncbi:hypothetical protein CONPUDRAFT_74636 [Coniophora puteana RWD-64-598 SS2]|uniref:Uncharacterized protein n=1 Tax=Coniophora puteana (strain RWD-64-598) TaxID=741705 RepID=A0A5M3MKE9_CONPW|nr:uncharacterized protein CONPUDRAFT_74636 [Coniophora puteana RWD-64-598 SS2]EIW79125.1 hypothetical protein CONPUDRAFT_74636 [Coniophora puteana RWD-64-598 SS2]